MDHDRNHRSAFVSLERFNIVCKLLQQSEEEQLDLDYVRVQFDDLIRQYLGMKLYLGADGDIVQNSDFKNEVVKIQCGRGKKNCTVLKTQRCGTF